MVDDFGIKYTGKSNAEYLLNVLRCKYSITTDWTGSLYCGMTLKWNYLTHSVDVSMPGYVHKALEQYQHPYPSHPKHEPAPWTAPNYGRSTQMAPAPDTSPQLSSHYLTRLQQIIGTFLFYACIVNPTMLVALGDLAASQTAGTTQTAQALTHFLDYCASNPSAIL